MPTITGWASNNGTLRFPLAAKGKLNVGPAVEISIKFGDQSEGIIIDYAELIRYTTYSQ